MLTKKYTVPVVVTACSVALASWSGIATAQSSSQQNSVTANASVQSKTNNDEAKSAMQQVDEAVQVVRKMEQDAELKKVMQQAQGIFILPDFGRAALGVGGRGGQGIVMIKQNGKWSDPAFYNTGGLSVGLQAGAEAGAIAMILNNQKAVDSFMQETSWSLNADAGLTVVNWQEKAEAAVGKGDVIIWADTKGLLGDVALSVTGIDFDEEDTAAFYGKQVALKDVFSGKVKAPSQVAALKRVLPAGSSATSSGSSKNESASSGSSASTGSTDSDEKSSGGSDSSKSDSGTSDASSGDTSRSNPPYTKEVDHPGQGTTGTGIGAPSNSSGESADEKNSRSGSTSGTSK